MRRLKQAQTPKRKPRKRINILTSLRGTANADAQNQVSVVSRIISNVARLTMLMAMFIEIVAKYGRKPAKRSALFNALQEGRQAEMEKKC